MQAARLPSCRNASNGWNSSLVNCQCLKNINGYQLRRVLRSIVENVVSTEWFRELSVKSKLIKPTSQDLQSWFEPEVLGSS